MLGGGVVVVLGTILNWGPEISGLNTDINGFFGILALLMGIAMAAVGGIKAFSPTTTLPEEFLGMSLGQWMFAAAFAVFLGSFSLITEDGTKIGVHLTWLGAAVAAVGAILFIRNDSVGTSMPTSI